MATYYRYFKAGGNYLILATVLVMFLMGEVCVCVCACVCACACVHVHACMCMCVWECVNVYMYVCMYMHACVEVMELLSFKCCSPAGRYSCV